MNTVVRRRAKRIGAAGIVVGTLLVGLAFLSGSDDVKVARMGQYTGTAELQALETSGMDISGRPMTEEETAFLSGELTERPATLPADAGIHTVESIPWGKGTLEVMAGEVMVKFSPALSESGRNKLIAQLGSAILQEDDTLGYVRLAVPAKTSIVSFQQTLRMTEGVVTAHPNAIMRGAANKCYQAGEFYGYQWHLGRFNHSNTCNTRGNDPTPVTVAVLDTGVAYENYGSYVKASDLNGVPIVHPFDFVNEDAHPNDDHQHGTHVTTTLLGMGKINGVTPGATLMPVKVLDATNKGNEYDLVQGIRWAVDHGAKIINMSLSFPASYMPSGLLQDAITYASANNVLVIASSGNSGVNAIPYPAAFREVISVGATRMKRLSGGTVVDDLASYSNYGAGLDLVAPGGSLQYDANVDGWPDGVLAQSIRPGNPSQTSYYFFSGTSQAAALASGVATWLMAAGATTTQARDAMLETAQDLGAAGYDTQYGQGLVNLDAAVSYFASQVPPVTPGIFTNIVPVMYKSGGLEWAVAKVRVTRGNGAAVANAKVLGRWSGDGVSNVSAVTDSQGWVTLASPTATDDADGSLFSVEISTVVDPATGRRVKPKEFYYMSQGFAALMAGTLDNEATDQSLIVLDIDPTDSTLAAQFDATKLTRSFSVKALGPSLGTPGVGITFTPDFIPGLEDLSLPRQEITLNFSGPKAFGGAVQSSGVATVYSGGVGLSMLAMNRSGGVGLSMLAMNKFGGVGLSMLAMNRIGGVGLSMLAMSAVKFDSAIMNGQSVDNSPVEIVRNEDPSSFISANPTLDGGGVALSLNGMRFAANSADTAVMDGIIVANSAEEAEVDIDNEMGMALGVAEFGGEPPTNLIIEE